MAAGKPAGPSISDETRPVNTTLNTDVRSVNYSNTIYHNGITFNFSTGVTWGRYISGDPWVLVSGPGITLSSIEPGLTLVSSNVYAPGVTFYINGSQKNRTPFAQPFEFFGVTYPGYAKQAYDQRGQGSVNAQGITFWVWGSPNTWVPSLGLTFPNGLSYGDSIISCVSSFDPNTLTNYACVEQRYHQTRILIKHYSILTAVNSIPSVDSYRPPMYWSNPKTRPTFAESQYERDINDYLINPRSNLRCLSGLTLTGPYDSIYGTNPIANYELFLSSYRAGIEKLLQSSYVYDNLGWFPYLAGGHDEIQPQNSGLFYGNTISNYQSAQLNNIWYPFFAGMFIKDIPPYLRQKALRRVTQYGIDLYGYMMSGGLNIQDGGHAAGSILPFVRFAGWMFGSAGTTMLNIHNHSTVSNYFRAGMTGASAFNPSFPKSLYNSNQDYWNKAFSFADYAQKPLIYNFGSTANGGWFNIGNPNVIVPYDRGFTYSLGYPNGFTGANLNSVRRLYTAEGWTGAGSAFKFGGITLDATNPASVLTSARLGTNYDYTTDIPGYFGKLKLSNQFKPRNPNFIPEGILGFNNGRYANNSSMFGLLLKIVSGGGSGPTEYRIIKCSGLHEDSNWNEAGPAYNIELTLDRNFQNGLPDSTSVIDIYPFSSEDTFPLPSYAIDPFWAGGITFTSNIQQLTSVLQNAKYSNRDYFTTNDGVLLRYYPILQHLGITQDQYLYDYQHQVYFANDVPKWAVYAKLFGTWAEGALGGPESFNSLLIARFKGLTEGSYLGDMRPSSGLDLPGFTA